MFAGYANTLIQSAVIFIYLQVNDAVQYTIIYSRRRELW
jgi:hypothetical protein